jgi:hypothetical protein
MLSVGIEGSQSHGTNCVINGGSFNGNAVNQAHGSDTSSDLFGDYTEIGGIWLGGQYDLIEYSTIYNCRMWGVFVSGSYSGCTNCNIYNIGWNGFTSYQNSGSGTVNEAFCTNCNVYACSDVGIDSESQNTIITGNNVYNIAPEGQPQGAVDSYWGIAWENANSGYGNCGGTGSGTYAICSGNTLNNCYYNGIDLADSENNYVLISGNTVTNTTHNGILLLDGGSNDIIEFNSLNNAYTVGINIYTSASEDNTIYGNTFSGCSPNISDSGTGTIYTAPSQ